ncbi:D-alanyl-D-alanine carboxypeptidase family protein [Caldanaerobius polysaccharolyticus]|uniref:D-alanyl-D-alanine carboxypeptidase family protein n=1 Tax=Caldanaerobius polysaccharolyticus TaxID=44256 RepID=UPI00047CA466|nr:D-alanyl-D-alanine carboxypeptidase family protein [Caldanaerobius polysaccharolyticus]
MKKAAIAILTFLLLLNSSYAFGATTLVPNIKAKSGIIMDYETGQVLYDKNGDVRVYPASTTKVLTAIIALESGKLDDVVTAGKDAVGVEGSSIYLSEGEQLTLKQLVHAMLIGSANDAAVAVAQYIGGSVEGFADMMNKKAQEIGAKNSHFVTPNGLHDPNHYTTAYDMALIARYAMKNPLFREIVDTAVYTIPPTNKFKEKRVLLNTNMLIRPTAYYYKWADGIKTGYTSQANRCLLTTGLLNGRRVIVSIYGDDPAAVWKDAIGMLNYGLNNFVNRTLVHKGDYVEKVPVNRGKAYVNLVASSGFTYTLPLDKANYVKEDVKYTGDVKAPVRKGEKLGYISYELSGKSIGKVDLIADRTVKKDLTISPMLSRFGKWVYWSILAPGAFILGLWMRKRRSR